MNEIIDEGGVTTEPAVNIDLVSFPRDKTVLVARTQTEFSVGCISLPNDAGIVVYFGTDVDPKIPTFTALVAQLKPKMDQTIELATEIAFRWSREHKMIPKFTSYIKDAAVNESPFKYFSSEPLSKREEMLSAASLSRIQTSGIAIPIAPILFQVLSS